jgi:hypothetical protein
MATILHPVTQISGAPSYTAQQIRRTVNPFIVAPNGTPFDGIQGVRSGCGTLLSISGNTVTIKRHAGQIAPFAGYGVYHYSMDADMNVSIPSMTASYKIAMVMSDQSLSQGAGNTIAPTVVDYSTEDSSVRGIVLGKIVNGVCHDTAIRISPVQKIWTFKLSDLPSVGIEPYQRANVTADGDNNGEYLYKDGNWVSTQHDLVVFKDANNQSASWYCEDSVVTLSVTWKHSPVSWDSGHIIKLPSKYAPRVEVFQNAAKDNRLVNEGDTRISIVPDGSVRWMNRGSSQGSDFIAATLTYHI